MGNAIILNCFPSPNIEELDAGGTVYPGHLLQLDSDGDVTVHSTDGGRARPVKVALEDELQGNDINDAYSADNRLRLVTAKPGDKLQMKLAAGEDIAIGDELVSNGDGTLRERASGDEETVAIAREAVDNTASAATVAWIEVEVA